MQRLFSVKVSGGMFLDMTIHDFDMVRFLAGCDAEEVYVEAAVLVDPAIGESDGCPRWFLLPLLSAPLQSCGQNGG